MPGKKLAVIIGAVVLIAIAAVAVSTRGQPAPAPEPGPISEETSWAIGETTVYATITRPDGDGPYPAVVFVPAMGPTDRDWNRPDLPGTNGSGRLLAEELARDGFVTIRYDKRYAGPNAGENLPHLEGKISLAGHVEEIAGAVEDLAARPYVDPDRIYILSHDEGMFHALNYHLEHGERCAGLVLTAPPARPLLETYMGQIRHVYGGIPGLEDVVPRFEALVADFLDGQPFVPDPELPASLNNQVQTWSNPGNLPYMREVLPLDPADLLPQATAPVLVVIGQKDTVTDWETGGALLQTATAGLASITYEFPRTADRMLKHDLRPREEINPQEYNIEGRVLDDTTVWLIKEWLKQQSQGQ